MLDPSVTPKLTRAEAARLNGAKSRGPRTPEGKARSARNALKHGLTAQAFALLPGEETRTPTRSSSTASPGATARRTSWRRTWCSASPR